MASPFTTRPSDAIPTIARPPRIWSRCSRDDRRCPCRCSPSRRYVGPQRIWREPLVRDAETDADLLALARAAHGHSDLILAGSAGLAGAAAAAWGHAGPVPDLPEGGSCLVVSGSRHPATRDQIGELERSGIIGVRLKRGGGESTRGVTDRLREGGVAFIASAEILDGTRAEMAARLAAAASTVLAEAVPAILVLTGGDTALAVLRALGARRLELVGAPATGLALGRIVLDGQPPLTVLTKAGGFGAPTLLASLARGAIR